MHLGQAVSHAAVNTEPEGDVVTGVGPIDNELFGVDRFAKLVCDCRALSLSQMFNYIDKDLKAFQQGNQFDDITMLAIKREI